jgi:hypothetical protein
LSNWLGRSWRDVAALLFLVSASFLFFAGACWSGGERRLFGYDVWRMFYPFGEFMVASLREGQLPLWNPTVFLGFPQYAEPQLSTFYFPLWLQAWLPSTTFYPWQYALHFAWTAVGGYVLVRRLGTPTELGRRRAGALLAGFTLTFALTMTVRPFVGHLPHVMTLSWVPWCLVAAHWAVEKKTWTAAILAGLPLGMAFLVGYIPYLILLIPTVTLFMLWLAWQTWREGDGRGALFITGQLAVIGLVAALLAGVQLLPSLEFAQYSNRTSGRYDYSDNESIHFSFLLTAFMPDLYGALQGPVGLWARQLSIDFYSEWALYVGILSLILFILAWLILPRRHRFWILIALLGLLMALGDKAGFNRILYDYVPGMNAFRFVSRPIYFLTLGVAVAAGLAFDHWFDLSPERYRQLAGWLKKLLWAVIALSLALLAIGLAYHLLLDQSELVGSSQPVTLGFLRQVARALLLVSASLALLIWGYGRPRWLVLTLALVILTLDLWGQGQKFLTYVDGQPYPEWATVDELLPGGRDDYRVLTKVLEENAGYFFGLDSIFGYDGFTLESSETLNDLSVSDARVVRLLSGRYLIHGPGWESPVVAPGWELMAQPGEMTIFERADSGPRAFMVHEVIGVLDQADALHQMSRPDLDFTQTAVVQALPNTQCAIAPADGPTELSFADNVQITEHLGDRVIIQVQAQSDGWLVLNELFYPGWQATVDGQPVTIQPSNYALRGVCLPAGDHEVIFSFQPQILTYGLLVSAAALVLIGAALVLIVWRSRK